MIKLIPGHRRDEFKKEIDAMHRLRKSIFKDTNNWDVPIINRWEVDGYDALNPLYVLSMDECDEVVGCLRLLPTMGFNMLNDTFPELLPEGNRVESPLIWESSRFAAQCPAGQRSVAWLSQITAELGMALNDIGRRAGLSHIVTVYDAKMHRMLKATRCAGEPISEPRMIGSVLTYAVVYEIGDHWEQQVRELFDAVDRVDFDQLSVVDAIRRAA